MAWMALTDLPLAAASGVNPARRYVDDTALIAILAQFSAWQGNVNAGGFNLSNIGTLSGVGIGLTSPTDGRISIGSSGGAQSSMVHLLARHAGAPSEWNIVAAGSGLAVRSLRFTHGSLWTGAPTAILEPRGVFKVIGDGSTDCGLIISGPSGVNRSVVWESAGSTRFVLFADAGGSTNLQWHRYDDSAAYLGTFFSVERSSGNVAIGNGGTINSGQRIELYTSRDESVHINDGIGSDPSRYATLNVHTRSGGDSRGSSIAFIRQGVGVIGLGFKHDSMLFGFGTGVTTNTFVPNLWALDAGNARITIGGRFNLASAGTYSNDAAAGSAGLASGDVYWNSTVGGGVPVLVKKL